MKLVIFDLDNTLYHCKNMGLWLVLNDIRHALWSNAERKARKVLAGVDYGNADMFHDALWTEMSVLTGAPKEKIADWYASRFLPSMVKIVGKHFKPREGAVELITSLHEARVKVCCLSDYPLVSQKIEALKLPSEFISSWSTEDMGAPKPLPRGFRLIANFFDVDPKDVLVVGDRADNDAAGALAAGMQCLLVENKRAVNDLGVEVLPWPDLCVRILSMVDDNETTK